jgi:acyl-coenzyme A synthetase/AMP-(fatty) acid ligase
MIDFLMEVFKEYTSDEAVIWKNNIFYYNWLYEKVIFWKENISKEGIKKGEVVVIEADFSPNSIALFLALADKNCIILPLTKSVKNKKQEFLEIAQAEKIITIDEDENITFDKLSFQATHEFYNELKKKNHPGLILFSSGSTGKSKAALHDLSGILEKFKIRKKKMRTITFLLYDHIGGVNTLLYVLSNGGTVITIQDRNPDSVFKLVQDYKAELIPTSPTFINLILISEAYKRYDLNSLKIVTYGTEPMPESTLKKFSEIFPNIKLQQTYGLSEIGILRSKSKSNDSLWVKIGGEGFETRVVNGLLEVKAKSAMIGYLNAPSPFTQDGWFMTGDLVEVNGEFIKILGRKSEIINVGGEKVYPAEVESVILEIDKVAEVTVYGERNPITGNIVCAKVKLKEYIDKKEFITTLKKYCNKKLQSFKVPIKVFIDDKEQFSDRFKKVRKTD